MTPADDVRAARKQSSQQTVSEQLSEEAKRPMTDERASQLAEAVAQAAIEYSKNPQAASEMMAVYADALGSVKSEATLDAILSQADAIAGSTLQADQLPSAVFFETDTPTTEAVAQEVDPIRDFASQMRGEAESQLDETGRTVYVPVREGAAPAVAPIPTQSGMAFPVGEPFADQAMAEQRGLLEGLGRTTTGLQRFTGDEAGILSQSDRPVLFQRYVAPAQDNVAAQGNPDAIGGLQQAIAQGGVFPEQLSPELIANLAEYPNEVDGSRVFPQDKINARLAQVLTDAVREGRTTADNVQGEASNLIGDTGLGTFENPLAGLVTNAPLSDRTAGDASITGVVAPPNPVAQFNPILAGLVNDQLAALKADGNLTPEQKARAARQNALGIFSETYGKELATPLFSYSQYGIQQPSHAVRDVRERMSGKQREYADAVAAFNNIIEATNQQMDAGGNPLGGLRFAASNQGMAMPEDSASAQRSAIANELATRIVDRLGNATTNRRLADYNSQDAQSQAQMSAVVRGLLSGLASGVDPSLLPSSEQIFLPVQRPQSLMVRSPQSNEPRLVGQSDFTGTSSGSGRSPFANKSELFSLLTNTDPRTGAPVLRNVSAADMENYIDPYRHFSFTSTPMGLFFDPYERQFGGAYVEGGSSYLPPRLAAEIAANAMTYEPGAMRDAFVQSMLRGYQKVGLPDDVGLGMRVNFLDNLDRREAAPQGDIRAAQFKAATEKALMPKKTLRDAFRLIPSGNFDMPARDIVDRALEASGTPVVRELPSTDAMQGMTPADDDFGAIPSLYQQQPMGNTLRMALPRRLGPIASLLVA